MELSTSVLLLFLDTFNSVLSSMCSALTWQWTVESRIWDVALSKQRVMVAHFHPENILDDDNDL